MFYQVTIQPEDRASQIILWRSGDDSREPGVYEMTAMTFGTACSPCIAYHVKLKNALEHKDSDPRAVKSISDFHYVDDMVDTSSSCEYHKRCVKFTEMVALICVTLFQNQSDNY